MSTAATVRFSKVVVAVDGSAHSREALRWAAQEAERHGSKLVVVMAWKFPPAVYAPMSPVVTPPVDVMADTVKSTLHQIVEFELGTERTIEVDMKEVYGGAAEALLQEADEHSLLVIGPRQRSTMSQVVLGSTTRHTLQRARCPVALVPTPA